MLDAMVGQIVLYYLPNGPHRGEPRPALVLRAEEEARPTLAVFTSNEDGLQWGHGPVEVTRAPWSRIPKMGHWRYRPPCARDGSNLVRPLGFVEDRAPEVVEAERRVAVALECGCAPDPADLELCK